MKEDAFENRAPERRSSWPRAFTIVCVVLVIAAAGLLMLRMARDVVGSGASAVKELGQSAATLARAFSEGTVRHEFISHVTEVAGTSYFQFATLKQGEIFQREESGSTGFGWIPLPKVVVQAQAPVEYTYYLDFDGPWEFAREGDLVTVLTPPIAVNTPALDVSALTFYTLEGSIWRDDKAVRERLKESLTATLHERALKNSTLVREIGRQRLAQFVEKWLLEKFSDGREFRVKVIFPEENPSPSTGQKPL